MTADERIQIMVDRIVHDFQPLQVLLFGSWARGTANHNSDVDLVVVLPRVLDPLKTTVEIRRSLRGIGLPKDVIVTTSEEIERRTPQLGDVLHYAIPDAQILYERA